MYIYTSLSLYIYIYTYMHTHIYIYSLSKEWVGLRGCTASALLLAAGMPCDSYYS